MSALRSEGGYSSAARALAAVLMWVFATAARAQDYRTAAVTFEDGRVATWEVLTEAPGDMARRLVTSDGSGVDTVREVTGIERLIIEGGGHYRGVRRSYRGFDGAELDVSRLARRIVTGPADLYRLDLRTEEKPGIDEVDRYGTWTYYLEQDGELYELPQEESTEGGLYRRRRDFVGRLNYLLRDCERLTARLRANPPRYRDADLATVLELYAQCRGGVASLAPDPAGRGRFAGVVASGGLFDAVAGGASGGPYGFVEARATWRLGRSTPAAFLEAGVTFVNRTRAAEIGESAFSPVLIPVVVRLEGRQATPVRPFVALGLIVNPPAGSLVDAGPPVLFTGGAGLWIGRACLAARFTPLSVVGESDVRFNIGLGAGYRFGGAARPRGRVPAR